MGLTSFLLAYILGGLTFLPLLLIVILVPAWTLLPRVDNADRAAVLASGEAPLKEQDEKDKDEATTRSRVNSQVDAAASGTFAVLRRYDFQAAMSALSARSNAGKNPGLDAGSSGGVGDPAAEYSGSSESVYQSMYRSVFDRNKIANSTKPLQESDELQSSKVGRRRGPPANVLYIVLRHGHLMVYDSSAQVEVKHVISLAHHRVSLQSGTYSKIEQDSTRIPEPDLFIKRTAIVLTPVEFPNGALQNPASQTSSKPFYLFSNTSIDKEDFYHALLYTRPQPPVPLALDVEGLIKLQSSLHSSSLTSETRALNALVGRVFLALHRTDFLTNFVRSKIENKLVRIQKPSFIPTLLLQSIDMGDSGPVLSNLRVRDMTIDGDLTVNLDMRYSGGLSLTLLAVAKLDLGPRFKARTVDLMLKSSIQRVQGTMCLRIKPPPSNRIWFTFESMPEMEIRVEPVVSERKITYGFVLRAIEERIRTAISEGLVRPNWDDVPLPLANTQGSHARGGLWSDEGVEEHPDLQSVMLKAKHQRTRSMPVTMHEANFDSEDVAQASSSDINLPNVTSSEQQHAVKRRPVLTSQSSAQSATTPAMTPRLIRSPSLSSSTPTPSVAIDGQNVERDDSSLRSNPPSSRWRTRGAGVSQTQLKDALEELREVRDRAQVAAAAVAARVSLRKDEEDKNGTASLGVASQQDVAENGSDDAASLSSRSTRSTETRNNSDARSLRSPSLANLDSDQSSVNSGTASRDSQMRKTTILAATAAATNAARTWGWNAIQKNRAALARPNSRVDQQGFVPNEPMGRGQPLPPPGVPLPGPQRGTWTGMTGVRRKPAPPLPPRGGPRSQHDSKGSTVVDGGPRPTSTETLTHQQPNSARGPEEEIEDEFGPWSENVDNLEDRASQALPDREMQDPRRASSGEIASSVENTYSNDLIHLDDDDYRGEATNTSQPGQPFNAETTQRPGPKKVPPPLPTRRPRHSDSASHVIPPPSANVSGLKDELGDDSHRRLSELSQLTGSVNHASDRDTSINDDEFDDDDDGNDRGSGLRVPESAAEAVDAENSTEAQAHGQTDAPPSQIDVNAGIKAEIQAETPVHAEGARSGVELGSDDAGWNFKARQAS